MERLYSCKQIADLIGVSERTIRYWRDTKGFPVYKPDGVAPRYRESEVEAWLQKFKKGGDNTSTSPAVCRLMFDTDDY